MKSAYCKVNLPCGEKFAQAKALIDTLKNKNKSLRAISPQAKIAAVL